LGGGRISFIPQNTSPMPGIAAWDRARPWSRAFGMDYPRNAAGLRRARVPGKDRLLRRGRAVREPRAVQHLAAGRRQGRDRAAGVVRPAAARCSHFAGQRVRQAYDSLASQRGLAAEMALLQPIALATATQSLRALGWAAAAAAGSRVQVGDGTAAQGLSGGVPPDATPGCRAVVCS